jgi:hypothetical protein
MIGSGYRDLPLADCVQATVSKRAFAFEVADGELSWRESWFVLTTNSHGGAAVIDCARSGPRSPVHYDNPEEYDLVYHDERAAPSTATVMAWWLDAISAGATGFDAARGGWWYDWQGIPSEREMSRLI